ncbi:sigma E protease regulator RseP [Parasalinivibrio latis]|uniref:sigma E protease regulator RseP n=1 Tax=Parasalinivibrio latis TaxID=2952610 RepID=UPI0030E10EDB
MMGFLWDTGAFLLALGVLITVHEFGHFWVARRCGVKVERFSIGFGKAIWRKTGKDGTEYTLAMIPLGGYVKMVDERVDDVPADQVDQAFNRKPLWQRSAIVAAGPLANFLFAIVAYWLVFIIGVPSIKPVIGEVAPQSIAAEAGIEPGMELKSISGVKTPNWEAVNMAVISHIGDNSMAVDVSPDGSDYTLDKTLNLTSWSFDPETQSALNTLGITPYSPAILNEVSQVVDGSPAVKAGLDVGDEIVSVNGKPFTDWRSVVEVIRANPGKQVSLEVKKAGVLSDLTLVPESRKAGELNIGYAGFAPKMEPWPESYRFDLQFGALEAIPQALDKTWQVVSLTFDMLTKLITGDVAIKNLSGPISIAKGAGQTADYGLVYFLSFLALISVNLGIINLLPLPVLDGGHLMFFGIEAITRKPVSERIQDLGYRLGSAIIVCLMAVALFNDFARL